MEVSSVPARSSIAVIWNSQEHTCAAAPIHRSSEPIKASGELDWGAGYVWWYVLMPL